MREIRPILNLHKRENVLLGGEEGVTLEQATGRNAAGHEKWVETGIKKSSGLSCCVLILFWNLHHLLSSCLLSTELHPASKCCTEELIPIDHELLFSHAWIQRETYPIFAPNRSIKPKMKVNIIFVITEDLVVHNPIDFCAWRFEQLFWPVLLTCLEKEKLHFKVKTLQGSLILTGPRRGSLELFQICTCCPALDTWNSIGNQARWLLFFFFFFFFSRWKNRVSERWQLCNLALFSSGKVLWQWLRTSNQNSKFSFWSWSTLHRRINPKAAHLIWGLDTRSPAFWSGHKTLLCTYKRFQPPIFLSAQASEFSLFFPRIIPPWQRAHTIHFYYFLLSSLFPLPILGSEKVASLVDIKAIKCSHSLHGSYEFLCFYPTFF